MQNLSPRLLSLKATDVFQSETAEAASFNVILGEAEEVDAIADVDEEIKAETEFKATRVGCRIRVCLLAALRASAVELKIAVEVTV